MVRIIAEEEIKEHLTMSDSIDALETLHEAFAGGRAVTSFMDSKAGRVPNPPAEATGDPVLFDMRTMDGIIEDFEVASVRINSDIVHWPKKAGSKVRDKIPATDGQYNGMIVLLSMNTGEPLAMFPDAIVQHSRVAGSSALGAKYLANDDASTLGMLGAGWQARSHLPALDIVCDLEEVNVYSPTPESRESFAEEMADEVSPTVRAVDEPQAVFEDADIVQCVTNAVEEPVFDVNWIEPGTHIGLIRYEEAPDEFYTPETLDAFGTNFPETVQHELYGQHYNQNRKTMWEWNNYVTGNAESLPRLERFSRMEPAYDWEEEILSVADLMTDDSVGRSGPDDVTGYMTAGFGADFTAVGNVVYDLAEEHDLGTELSTGLLTQDNHP